MDRVLISVYVPQKVAVMAAKTEYGELPFAPTEEDLASLTEAERAYLLRRFVLGNKSLHVECVQPNWPA